MSISVTVTCDGYQCDAEATIMREEGEWDGLEVLRDTDQAVVDSGWVRAPAGWMLGVAGDLCPEHVGKGST